MPKIKPIVFPKPLSKSPLGSFMLVNDQLMIFAKECSSPFGNKVPFFVEDKIGPPSRAYLKLYEAFTRLNKYPKPSDKCLEIGASPGGWTWVLAKVLHAHVIACDRSPLERGLGDLKNVTYSSGDAFQQTPDKVGPLDWIVSDIICYPNKLYEWIQKWLDSGLCKNYIITVKLQGENYQDAVEKFRKIPNSKLLHQYNNKHELTWFYPSV